MNFFDYESHLERQRQIVRERDHERLVKAATGRNGRLRPVRGIRQVLQYVHMSIQQRSEKRIRGGKLVIRTAPMGD